MPQHPTLSLVALPACPPTRPDTGKGPGSLRGPFARAVRQRVSTRVCVLSAPYWKMPIDACVGSPFSSNVTGPE